MSQGLFEKWEFSVRASQHTVESETSYTCTQAHTFQSFSGNNIMSNRLFVFVVFTCYHSISITLLGYVASDGTENYFSFRDFQMSCSLQVWTQSTVIVSNTTWTSCNLTLWTSCTFNPLIPGSSGMAGSVNSGLCAGCFTRQTFAKQPSK